MQMELEVGNVGFLGVGKTGVTGEEPTQSKYEDELRDRSRTTLVGEECLHNCAIPAPSFGFAGSKLSLTELPLHTVY